MFKKIGKGWWAYKTGIKDGWGSGSHDKWLQQDWIEFREVKTLTI